MLFYKFVSTKYEHFKLGGIVFKNEVGFLYILSIRLEQIFYVIMSCACVFGRGAKRMFFKLFEKLVSFWQIVCFYPPLRKILPLIEKKFVEANSPGYTEFV